MFIYSAHHVVIFAVAQLSCFAFYWPQSEDSSNVITLLISSSYHIVRSTNSRCHPTTVLLMRKVLTKRVYLNITPRLRLSDVYFVKKMIMCASLIRQWLKP